MEETSLTDFVGDDPAPGERDSPDDGPDGEGTPAGAGSPDDGTPDTDEVDPATVTASWSPSGATCEGCGTTAGWRWHADGTRVCEDCRSW